MPEKRSEKLKKTGKKSPFYALEKVFFGEIYADKIYHNFWVEKIGKIQLLCNLFKGKKRLLCVMTKKMTRS